MDGMPARRQTTDCSRVTKTNDSLEKGIVFSSMQIECPRMREGERDGNAEQRHEV